MLNSTIYFYILYFYREQSLVYSDAIFYKNPY